MELDLTKGSAEKSAVRLIDAYEGQCPNDGMDVECHPETWTLSKNICIYTTVRCLLAKYPVDPEWIRGMLSNDHEALTRVRTPAGLTE